MLGNTPVTWKMGVKIRDREKVRDQNLFIWERDDVALTDFISANSQISGWRMNNPMYEWPSAGLTRALRGTFTADELDEEGTNFDSLAEDYTIDEMIIAGAMNDGAIPGKAVVRVGNSLTMVDAAVGGLDAIRNGTTFTGEGFTISVAPAAGDQQRRPANVTVRDAAGQTQSYSGNWICS